MKGAQRKILVESPEPGNKAQRKVEHKNYHAITMSRNYEEKLLRGKCEIYRDTGVSKNCSARQIMRVDAYTAEY